MCAPALFVAWGVAALIFLGLFRRVRVEVLARRPVAAGQRKDHAREQQEAEQVGQHHQRVGDVAHAPDQVALAARTDEDAHAPQHSPDPVEDLVSKKKRW